MSGHIRHQLKVEKYGHIVAGGSIRQAKSTENAKRLARDTSILENRFQIGFGALARDLRGWTA